MAQGSKTAVGERLAFGEFELAPAARTLWRYGVPVKLGRRALEILIALASRPGEVLSKEALTQLVWGDVHVEETALRVGVSAARKALGDGGARYIATVPGRGYCFVLDVEATSAKASAEEAGGTPHKTRRPPPQIIRIVGRDAVVDALAESVSRRRLISLVGPGGIGKTTVALAVLARLQDAFDRVAFVDLAPIEDGSQMSAAVAAAFGLNVRLQQDPVEAIVAAAQARRVLLVLDNCEHIVDGVAVFIEDLLGQAVGLTVLATTRELLRAAGEWVHQLSPLEAPPVLPIMTATNARRYPAVALFEDRAAHALGGYQLDDADAVYVADICRRLDGIALAIELAAGRVADLGVQGLARSLANSFQVLTHGRRTALPRHQTLRATFDWSYRLLTPDDQAVLMRLSVFSGDFTQNDAIAVAAAESFSSTEIDEHLASLHDKSLVTARPAGIALRYRLLDATRAYAKEKLEEGGDAGLLRRRHAQYVATLFDQAQAEWDLRPTADWLQTYSVQLGNLRTALDWSFSQEGDGALGAALTAAAAPLWFHLSLLDEGLLRVERAIAWLKQQPDPDHRLMMQLYAVSGWPQMRAIKGIPSGAAAWKETLRLAVELDDVDYQLRALWALWVDSNNGGAVTESLVLADRFAALAERAGDPEDRMVGRRLRGKSLHFLGDFAGSRRETEQMLDLYAPPSQRSHVIRFQYDQRLTAQITLARNLWLLGYAEQALALVEQMVTEATALDHTLTLAHVLSDATCFVALWVGDLALATHYVDMLRTHTSLHALDVWHTYSEAFEAEIMIRQGRANEGVGPLRRAIKALESAGFVLYNRAFEGVLAEGLLALGRSGDALAVVEIAVERCHSTGEAWCLPELMRIQALGLAAADRPHVAAAVLREGLKMAHGQGALSWELRLATALVQVDESSGPHDTLRDVMKRMSEGFAMSDYLRAAAMLAAAC